MKITWEESDIRPGVQYEFQVESGHWVHGTVAVQDYAIKEGQERKGVGAKTPGEQQHVIIVSSYTFIGPFENRQALVNWMNETQRARIK